MTGDRAAAGLVLLVLAALWALLACAWEPRSAWAFEHRPALRLAARVAAAAGVLGAVYVVWSALSR